MPPILLQLSALVLSLLVILTALPCVLHPRQAPPWPSLPTQRRAACRLLQKYLPEGSHVLEIGPGFSPVARALPRSFHLTLQEIAPIPFLCCRLWGAFRPNLRVLKGDALRQPLPQVDAVLFYQGTDFARRFARLWAVTPAAQRPPLVCSIAFPLQEMVPVEKACLRGGDIFLYSAASLPTSPICTGP